VRKSAILGHEPCVQWSQAFEVFVNPAHMPLANAAATQSANDAACDLFFSLLVFSGF